MQKVCLVIIDGFGLSEDRHYNAAKYAEFIEEMKSTTPYVSLKASGKYVGLPDGYNGNSEVGHMTIGAGKRIEQSLLRINRLWKEGLFANKIKSLNLSPRVHIVGLLSDGGVHSHIEHLRFLIDTVPGEIFFHAIADGIDTPPNKFFEFLRSINCQVASISGRYYAMDRDENTERVASAFNAMTSPNHPTSTSIADRLSMDDSDIKTSITSLPNILKDEKRRFIDHNYADEYIPPIRLLNDRIKPEDTVIFCNFRADRMRHLAILFKEYRHVYTMTDYGLGAPFNVIFEAPKTQNTLPEWLSKHSLTQAHIAESEKYAHVTYFFNGGREVLYPGETRKFVKSPSVNGFDDEPETSMNEVKSKCIDAINQFFDFIVVNLAAPDLVGHSGNFEAAIKAVKTADGIVRDLHQFCLKKGYLLMIASDHGNVEQMRKDGREDKSHTTNDISLLLLGSVNKTKLLSGGFGELADVAPTILDLMDLPTPKEMTGRSLLKK